MATLPSSLHRDAPGVTAIELFIGGDGGSWEEQWTFADDGSGYSLAGITPDFDIRTDLDGRIILATATVSDAANRVVTLSLTEAQVASIGIPDGEPRRGARVKLGRFNMALNDDAGRWVMAHGDVWGVR